MRIEWLNKKGSGRVIVFFHGWGMDAAGVSHLQMEDDVLMCYDYRSLDFDFPDLGHYRCIYVVAWSMGVWVAGQILSGHTYPWEMKLAVNGTPFPIDDRRGIAEAVFHGTLENFSDATLARFRRRICGGAGQVKEFLSHQPYRTTEELGAELAALEHEVGKVQPAAFVWDKAIIGLCDKIFIPANQRAAWTGTEVMEVEAEHYDTVLFDRLLEGKGEEWTRR